MIVNAFIFLVFLLLLNLYWNRRPKHFPPGPAWLPIVGNTFQVRKLSKQLGGFHLALLELSKQWKTNVLGLKLGREYFVAVFTYPIVKSVLSSDSYDARPDNFFIKLRCLGSINGITCTNGELWSIQRTFVVKTLRTLGLGKRITEELVQQEISDILNEITTSKEIRVGKLVAPAVISVLWSLITGTRLPRKDVRLNKLLDLFEKRALFFDMSGGLLGQHPWLRFLAPELTGYNLINNINNELKSLFMEAIQQHHESWAQNLGDSNLIYAYISEMKKENPHFSFTDDQLLMICLDLFIAGSQTTSSSLDLAFLMLLEYPEVQRKIQNLLDEVFEQDHVINYSDRQKVPYIEAVLLEVARYRTVTPVIGPRKVLKDVTLEGYHIPKGTTVFIHTHSVHMDPVHWGDPELFRPERFLQPNGKLIYDDELIPFGAGRRRCIGESLAKTCMFIFFTEILRNYSIIGKEKDDFNIGKPLAGLTLSAEYSAQFVKRSM